MKAANKQLAEWDKELDQLHARNGDLGLQVQMLQSELEAVKSDRPEIQESVPAVAEFLEAADVLNQLRTRRKKSRADLADIEAILEILLSWTDRPEKG
ncbi:MAG: flagellar alpha dynein [Microcoleus sp.]